MYRLFDSKLSGDAWKVRILLRRPGPPFGRYSFADLDPFPCVEMAPLVTTGGAYQQSRPGAHKSRPCPIGFLVEEA